MLLPVSLEVQPVATLLRPSKACEAQGAAAEEEEPRNVHAAQPSLSGEVEMQWLGVPAKNQLESVRPEVNAVSQVATQSVGVEA